MILEVVDSNSNSSRRQRLPKMRRNAILGKGSFRTIRKKRTTLSPTKKPSHISKRSVSLPTDLENASVKTRKLFWFIPEDRQRQTNHYRPDYPASKNNGHERTVSKEECQATENGEILPKQQQHAPVLEGIPETSTWIKPSPSIDSLESENYLFDDSLASENYLFDGDDDNDDDSLLVGLEFC